MVITRTGAGASHDIDVNVTGAGSENVLDITYATGANTGNAIDLNMGTNLAGNALDIARAGIATGKHIALSQTGAGTGDFLEINLTNTTAAIALDIQGTVATTTEQVNLDSSFVGANNIGAVTIDHGTGVLIAGAALMRIDTDAAHISGAVASDTPCALLELVASSTTATAYTALVIDAGASARTQPLIWIEDNNTAAGTGAIFDVDLRANTTGAAQVFDFDVDNVAWAGDVFNIGIGGASVVGARVMYVDATAAHTQQLFEIDSQGTGVDNEGLIIDIAHATGVLVAGGNLVRVESTAVINAAAYLFEINMTAATAAIALRVDGGAAARTSNLCEINDASTDTTGASLYINNATAAAKALHVDAGYARFDGRILGAKGADVASGTDIVLGDGGNFFDITGTTAITTISATGWTTGSIIVLQTDASVTLTHATAGTGAQLWLVGAANISMTANDTIMLVYDGVYWRQCAGTVAA